MSDSLLNVLFEVEKDLPQLIWECEDWLSLRIDYEKPYVDRLWRSWISSDGRQFRVYLHCISPCEVGEAFYHPHPWPSIIRVLGTAEGIGHYEMGVGTGEGIIPPETGAVVYIPGYSDFIYEMTNKNGWHYVRPISKPTYSIMITGEPWGREMPKVPNIEMSPLTVFQHANLLTYFRSKYPKIA